MISSSTAGYAGRENGAVRANSPGEICDFFLDAYRDRGAAALENLNGDFALAVLDRRRGDAMLAVDRACIRNLTYQATRTGLLFGSTLDALAGHPDARRELNRQALYEYAYFHMIPGPDTVFATTASPRTLRALRRRRGEGVVLLVRRTSKTVRVTSSSTSLRS
jgi:asparagine synthetase B (glutamine-hydrolysing)